MGGESFRRGALTNVFYIANWYHDRLYALGFDEAAGNFQLTNFSTSGTAGDRILIDAADYGVGGGATFGTPPDGISGRMQLGLWPGGGLWRDTDLDAEVVLHELTHGLSHRLLNSAGLNWTSGQAMGEGWSDFYALSLLNENGSDDPDGHYAFGAYSNYKYSPSFVDNYVYGVRHFPYTTDNGVNPLTWADADASTVDLSGGIAPSPNLSGVPPGEIHFVGEI